MEKCFNIHCDDHNAEAENGCHFPDEPNKCMGFISKETWRKKMEDNKKGGLPPNATGGSRMGARSVLLDKIERCKKELKSLQTLEESIQWENLSVKNEEFLWHYFSSRRESY